MTATQQTIRRVLYRETTATMPPALRNPRWAAIRSAFQAGFSAAEVTYMLDLSDDELRNYYRRQRELRR